MSRGGGRGGGRGGRGGGRGGRPNVPWDTGDEPDGTPSALFPARSVPTPRNLTPSEKNGIQHFLLLRHQIHASSLYTSRRSLLNDPTAPRKMYGRAQMNALYGVKSKASVDPFTAVPAYSHRFERHERALPDWSGRSICRELFPQELLDTVEPDGGSGARKKRKLDLGAVGALPNAEEAFGMPALNVGEDGAAVPTADGEGQRRLLERLETFDDEAGEDDDEEAGEPVDQDEEYDDEDAGDYDAENYFDNGDEMGDDYGDGDDGEGVF